MQTRLFPTIFSTLLLSFLSFSPLYSQNALSPDTWQAVTIDANMQQHLDLLPKTEQSEQRRDWIVLAFMRQISPTDGGTTAFENLYDFPILRNDALSVLTTWQYGEKRQLNFKNGTVYVFIPENSNRQKLYVARAADEYRLLKGQKPKSVVAIMYRLADNNMAFALQAPIPNEQIFGQEYGYTQKSVSNRSDLTAFLQQIDDLAFAEKNSNGSVTFAGRRFEAFRMSGVSYEDIAAIYQADNKLEEEYRQRVKKMLNEQYHDWLDEEATSFSMQFRLKGIGQNAYRKLIYNKKERKWSASYEIQTLNGIEMPSLSGSPVSAEFLKAEMMVVYPYKIYEDEWIKQYQEDRDFNIGFSLDPDLQNKKFSDDLQRFVNGDTVALRQWFNRYMKNGLIETTVSRSDFRGKARQTRLSDKKVNADIAGKDLQDTTIEEDNSELEEEEASLGTLISGVKMKIPPSVVTAKSTVAKDTSKSEDAELEDELSQFFKLLSGDKITPAEAEKMAETKFDKLKKDIKKHRELLNYIAKTVGADNTVPYFNIKAYLLEEIETSNLTGKIDRKILKLLEENRDSLYTVTEFLDYFYQSNRYQKARYDGYFNGTGVGMTLFYTDLIMKLWSFNYKQSTPENDVDGFISEVNHPISANYYDDMTNNPSTRSWLGVLESGYDVSDDKTQLYFSHCATKIFNASSNDLRPGEEVDANYASERFATWWNNHYSEVADYEGEYHRLNQIMKWSQVCHWLKIDRRFNSFLDNSSVNHSLDFSTWYPANPDLKVKVTIPFLNKRALGESTECLAILESAPYLAFQNAESLIYHLSGGVSLGAKSDIVKRAGANFSARPLLTGEAKNLLRPNFNLKNLKNLTNGELKIVKFNKTNINISPRNRAVTFNNKSTKLRGSQSELSNTSDFVRNIKQEPTGNLTVTEKALIDKPDVVRVNSTAPNKVDISIEPSDVTRAQDFVKKLSQKDPSVLNNLSEEIGAMPEVETALLNQERFEAKEIWVKLKGNDTWLSITISSKPVRADMRFATYKGGYFTNHTDYYHVNFKNTSTVQGEINRFRYRTVSTTYDGKPIVELKNILPADAQKISIRGKNIADDVWIDPETGNVSISNAKINTEDVTNFAKNNHKNLTTTAQEGSSGAGLTVLKDANGNPLSIGNRLATPEELDLLGRLGINANSNIKSVVIVEGKPIALLEGNVLRIPKNMSATEVERAAFLAERVQKNPQWANVFKNTEGGYAQLSKSEFEVLKAIHPDNVALGENFWQMKNLKLLPDEATVDFRFSATNPQVMARDANGIQVAWVEGGKAIIDAIKTVQRLTNAKKIITVEAENAPRSIQLESKIHNVATDRFWIKDQPNLAQSLDNSRDLVYPDLMKTAFLSTVSFNTPVYPEIQMIGQQISLIGFYDTLSDCTIRSFYDRLEDPAIQQIILFARANDRGIVFKDGTLSYDELAYQLGEMLESKEMFCIISNKANKIQQLVSESGKFKNTLASRFKLGEASGVTNALQGLMDFYHRTTYKADVKAKTWTKWVKESPVLGEIADKYTKITEQTGRRLEIPVGKFSAKDIQQIPVTTWEKLVKSTAPIGNQKMPFEARTIFNSVDDAQWMRVNQMRGKGGPIKMDFGGLLDFKADIMPRLKGDKC